MPGFSHAMESSADDTWFYLVHIAHTFPYTLQWPGRSWSYRRCQYNLWWPNWPCIACWGRRLQHTEILQPFRNATHDDWGPKALRMLQIVPSSRQTDPKSINDIGIISTLCPSIADFKILPVVENNVATHIAMLFTSHCEFISGQRLMCSCLEMPVQATNVILEFLIIGSSI